MLCTSIREFDLRIYAKDGLLTPLDDVAVKYGWDKILKPSIRQLAVMMRKGSWVRVNCTA